jgi:ribonuclease P protein component
MSRQRFLSGHHIRKSGEFQRAFRRRFNSSDSSIRVFGCPNGLPFPRLGLSVSRRVGGAVVRNRWKRLLREAFRLTQSRLPPGLDLIVVPRAVEIPTLDGLMESLPRHAARLSKKCHLASEKAR